MRHHPHDHLETSTHQENQLWSSPCHLRCSIPTSSPYSSIIRTKLRRRRRIMIIS
ncbi:hypothetical protein B296_00044795 [Ensete ventricosum]|uniref:Uncharacterized protein n=1 Tax=Ensete ventricosum TaxID=4639 RepID=A0A426XUD7_ENSVE|nr:hypothetical protein B296_00044795 [Ensete ventricosum]